MKRINKLFPLLLCACLSLAGCTGSGEKQLEKMRGEWVHVKGHPAFTLSETGRQIYRHPESKCQGQGTGNRLSSVGTGRKAVYRNRLCHTADV